MAISTLVLQRRHAELGRIRLGSKGDRGQPQKLSAIRFTSPSERFIRDLATLYGGEARAWDNGGKPEFEVYTQAKSIPVVVVKGGLSQWMETWSGGGCVHRCDGITDAVTGQRCDPDDPKHKAAKPTTRLSVMLPELEAIGAWRMESHGWNAAAEIPNAAEIAAHVGDLVKANLHLVERRSIKDGKTSRFVVPVLDLEVSQRRLLAIAEQMSGGAPAIESGTGGNLQIESGPSFDPSYYLEDIDDATTKEALNEIWRAAGNAGHLTDQIKAAVIARGAELDEEQPGDEGATEGEVEEDLPDDLPGVWNQIVAEAGKRGIGNQALIAAIEQETACPVAECTVEQFQAFLTSLKAGQVAA